MELWNKGIHIYTYNPVKKLLFLKYKPKIEKLEINYIIYLICYLTLFLWYLFFYVLANHVHFTFDS